MAFSGGANGRRKAMADINVTPLVDVMLVLLIIFMVTAPMLQQGVQVALPKTTTAPIPSNAEPLVLTLTLKGEAFVGKTKMESARLSEQVKEMMKTRSDKTVYLRADKGIAYGKVMTLIGQLKKGGIEAISLVSEAEEG